MSQRADARQGVLLTAAGRAVCRAVGTTAWAVLCELALDAEADAHGNLVTATNVRRIAVNLGISKDTAARALSRLVDAGLVVRHCRRGAGRRILGARVTSTVLAESVAVGAGVDQRGAHVSAHLSRPSPVATRVTLHGNDALTVQHPELAYPPPTNTDDLTTAPSALHHVHDRLTTTATTIASTATNHYQDPSRHWHPAVPFPGVAVTGAAEAAKAATC